MHLHRNNLREAPLSQQKILFSVTVVNASNFMRNRVTESLAFNFI